ncbi:MAG: GH3 family acyl-acid amido synthetase [Thermoanaerobaculia bacterium]
MKPRIVGSLFSLWARRRLQTVDALARRAPEAQGETLAALLETARATAFGREHGFSGIRTHADFARNVPVRSYVETLPWLHRVFRGEEDVTWPGRARWFAKTSGTTAGDKAIPVTDALVAQNRRAGRDVLAFHVRSAPGSRLFEGELLFLGGSTSMEPVPAGGQVGDLSGIMSAEMPFWLRRRVLPSPGVVAIRDWELKLEAIARETLGRDLTLLSGMPSWSLLLFERWRALSGGRTPADLFPGLELFVHGGVRYEPYRETLEASFGNALRRLEVYPASEGFLAVQDDPGSAGMSLGLDYGTFYEFIPAVEAGSPSARRLTLAEVRIGETYSIVLSNVAGLWAYEIGDLVRFVSLSPPRVTVVGRTTAFSNCCGENLIVEEVEEAFVAARAATGARAAEFTVAARPGSVADGRPRLEWVVESADSSFPAEAFARAADAVLRRRNHDYDTKRSGDIGMLLPVVALVPPGTFHSWMRSRGKLGGQHKVPRLRNDREVADALLAAA